MKLLLGILLIVAPSLHMLGCVAAGTPPEPVIIMQQTAGKSERFTQFELDVAFRKQERENARAYNPKKNVDVCCVVFPSDIEMLGKVLAHFREHVSADVDGYGILVQEDEEHYIVSFRERYRESTQYLLDGFWIPGIRGPGLEQYAYLVDRNTLEILEFIEVPN
jgi:hypothetical protein